MSDGIINLDFETHFPYKFWISSELLEERRQYKILSSRDEEHDEVTFCVVRDTSEAKTVLYKATARTAAFDRVIPTILTNLFVQYDIEYTFYDFSYVRTPEEFAAATTAVGWFAACLSKENN